MIEHIKCPVGVGGVDGSGTRVISMILEELNVYLGVQNRTSDNMWFSLLVKRPRWLRRASDDAVREGLRIFEKEMTSSYRWRADEMVFVVKAAFERMFNQYNHEYTPLQNLLFIRKLFAMLHSRYDPAQHIGWGWKEPNSHVLLRHTAAYFPDLRFVHVIRHGLDMAFSHIQNQVNIWGHLFDVSVPDDPARFPAASLEFWIRANRHTVDVGRRLLGDRFMLLDFDALCDGPRDVVTRLVSFLGLDPGRVDLDKLSAIPRKPRTSGRYKTQDLSVFDPRAIDAVKSFGYEVEV